MYFFQNMYLAQSLSEAFALFDAHPAARWIAPSTPPPPSSEFFAALTIASTASRVISACFNCNAIKNLPFNQHSTQQDPFAP